MSTPTVSPPDDGDDGGAVIYEFTHDRRTPAPAALSDAAWRTGQDRRGIADDAVTSPVVEGVVVNRGVGPDARAARRARARQRARTAWRLARLVGGHAVTRGAFRQVVYVAAGVRIGGRRLWESKTSTVHDQLMRAAAAQGNHDMALEWEERGRQARQARHERRMALLTAPVDLARGIVGGTAGLAFLLLAVGIAMAAHSGDIAEVGTPFALAADVVMFVYDVISATWRPALTAAPLLALAWAWMLGKAGAELPPWLGPMHAIARPEMVEITPSIVVVALRDLGVAELRKRIKDMGDLGAQMLGPISLAGRGVEVDVHLPSGVDTQQVMDRRLRLAQNLSRHEHEVFITIPPRPRTVRLWVADSGALDEPIGPSPLVTDPTMTADWYTGRAPWGQDLRGDPVGFSPFQRHVIMTGISNQGKTATLRAPALWAALDPTVEFRIGDLKGVGDWRPFDGIATVLIQGPTDAHVIAVVEMVEATADEMEERLLRLQESGAPDGVDRDMARKPGSGFHPIVVIVDEAQVAFMCPAVDEKKRPYGGTKALSRYYNAVRRIQNQGRAVNVTIWQGTQDPTDANFPVIIRNGAHVRATLVLASESQARMVLGDAVDAGAAPHKLRRGLDKGQIVVIGEGVDFPAGQTFLNVRTHFVSGAEAAEIAERAKTLRAGVVTRDSVTGDDLPPLDVLADVAAILGDSARALVQDVMRALADRDARYAEWTNAGFKAAMETAEAPTYVYHGRMHVHGERVREALIRRFSATD